MADFQSASYHEPSLKRIIIRCGCKDPMSHAILQQPCPTPLRIEDYPETPAEIVRPTWRL